MGVVHHVRMRVDDHHDPHHDIDDQVDDDLDDENEMHVLQIKLHILQRVSMMFQNVQNLILHLFKWVNTFLSGGILN